MAFVNIENTAISLELSSSETITVPTGETWKVTLAGAFAGSPYSDGNGLVRINSTTVLFLYHSYNYGSPSSNASINVFLKGGDIVSVDTATCHISGFVVQQI